MNLKQQMQILQLLRNDLRDKYQLAALRAYWQERGVHIDGTVTLRLQDSATLHIGEGTTVGRYTVLDLLSDPQSPHPQTSRLLIGARVAINEFNNIRAGGATVSIGDGCLISQYVSIIGTNHSLSPTAFIRDQPWDMSKKDVFIGEDVWVGAHAILLPGVTIGARSVVAAGAVVTSDIQEATIVGGVPARVIGYRR